MIGGEYGGLLFIPIYIFYTSYFLVVLVCRKIVSHKSKKENTSENNINNKIYYIDKDSYLLVIPPIIIIISFLSLVFQPMHGMGIERILLILAVLFFISIIIIILSSIRGKLSYLKVFNEIIYYLLFFLVALKINSLFKTVNVHSATPEEFQYFPGFLNNLITTLFIIFISLFLIYYNNKKKLLVNLVVFVYSFFSFNKLVQDFYFHSFYTYNYEYIIFTASYLLLFGYLLFFSAMNIFSFIPNILTKKSLMGTAEENYDVNKERTHLLKKNKQNIFTNMLVLFLISSSYFLLKIETIKTVREMAYVSIFGKEVEKGLYNTSLYVVIVFLVVFLIIFNYKNNIKKLFRKEKRSFIFSKKRVVLAFFVLLGLTASALFLRYINNNKNLDIKSEELYVFNNQNKIEKNEEFDIEITVQIQNPNGDIVPHVKTRCYYLDTLYSSGMCFDIDVMVPCDKKVYVDPDQNGVCLIEGLEKGKTYEVGVHTGNGIFDNPNQDMVIKYDKDNNKYSFLFTKRDLNVNGSIKTIEDLGNTPCIESDGGGKDYYKRGEINRTISLSREKAVDRCLTDSGQEILLEYYCKDGYLFSGEYKCREGCLDGACVILDLKGEEYNCYDTDGGYNIFEKGYLKTKNGYNDKEDYCDGDRIIEYECNLDENYSSGFSHGLNCPNGCSDGACVRGDEATLSDLDSDGLINKDEEKYGTDINNPDTDGDGYSDGDEVKNGYNPNGDGLLIQ